MLRSPWPIFAIFLAGHLAFAAWAPLVEDEGYYALWASIPSAGYYDHPPMVAWFAWPGMAIFGVTPLGIRLGATLAFALSTLLVWDSARLISGSRETGGWAALFYNASLLVLGLGSIASPDAPSALFWSLALWALLRASVSRQTAWWLVFGLAIGAGGISKFTNSFLTLGLLGWMLTTRPGLRALATPGPWLAALVSLIVVAPYLWWNYQHDWLGFERQLSRLDDSAFNLATFIEYPLVTFLLPTPLIAWFALRGAFRPTPALPAARALLVWSAVPLIAYMAYHATHAQVQPNWTVPLHGAFAIWAALALQEAKPQARRLAAITGFVFAAVVFGVVFKPGTPVNNVHNPPNQMRGWPPVLTVLDRTIAETGAEWIVTDGYGLTGQLWPQTRPIPIWDIAHVRRYPFRPEFPRALCNAPGLYVTYAGSEGFDPAKRFESADPPVIVQRTSGGTVLARYRLQRVQGLTDPALCP